jgi:hypothetical protein
MTKFEDCKQQESDVQKLVEADELKYVEPQKA